MSRRLALTLSARTPDWYVVRRRQEVTTEDRHKAIKSTETTSANVSSLGVDSPLAERGNRNDPRNSVTNWSRFLVSRGEKYCESWAVTAGTTVTIKQGLNFCTVSVNSGVSHIFYEVGGLMRSSPHLFSPTRLHRPLLVFTAAAALAVTIASPVTAQTTGPATGATPTVSEAPATTPAQPAPETSGAPAPAEGSTPSSTMPSRPSTDTGTPRTTAPNAPQARAHLAAGCQGFYNGAQGRWYTLCGRILDKYNQLGGPRGLLGDPTSDELTNPDGVGKRTSFTNDSSIYWSPDTDAHQIGGAIGAKWAELGYEGGLGYPTSDELETPDGRGRYNSFQRDASIYYTANTGAHSIGGLIGKRWGELGWEKSYLGYPTTDELPTPNGAARFNHFEGGSIYWSSGTGAHDLTAEMMSIWSAFGWETGELGLPTGNTVGATRPDPTVTLQRARAARGPQELRFQRGVGVVSQNGEAFAQTAGAPSGPPDLSEEDYGITSTLQSPEQAVTPYADDDGRWDVRAPSTLLKCSKSKWVSIPPQSYLRTGYFNGRSGFGLVKAQKKHKIGPDDSSVLGSAPTIAVWARTLFVAGTLGGGCFTGANEPNDSRGRFYTRFSGLDCVWNDRICRPSPSRNITVVSVEESAGTGVPSDARVNYRLGNITLHCLNADRSAACPEWLPRAVPFRKGDPGDGK